LGMLQRLPKHFGVMVAVSELFLDNNEIRELPKSMRTMKNIVSLHVNRNEIYNWPWCLEYLTTLTELHLSHNQIEGGASARRGRGGGELWVGREERGDGAVEGGEVGEDGGLWVGRLCVAPH